MMNILTLLQIFRTTLPNTDIRRMYKVIQAMLSMTGRITMLGISRWSGAGGSYRTIQRFFNTTIVWGQIYFIFFKHYLFNPKHEYFMVGDECVVTKSGKFTYGLDRFYAGLQSKVVKSIAIFSLSIVSVNVLALSSNVLFPIS